MVRSKQEGEAVPRTAWTIGVWRTCLSFPVTHACPLSFLWGYGLFHPLRTGMGPILSLTF